MSFNPVAGPLNQGQTEAENAFFAFLFNDEKEFIISGPGGVGKTHLMGHLIDTTIPRYFDTCKLMGIEPKYTEVHMRATTNKAAEVLGKATGRPSGTIQSFLGLKVTENYDTGQAKLTKTNAWTIKYNMIIFIDECSMIDGQLYQYINEGTENCKIVYVGDHCQLAPVMETLSPVYKQGIAFYELTEPMRTNVPELQALNKQLRTTVETGIFQPIQIVPGIIDHVDDAGLAYELQQYFVTPEPVARALAFTNNRVLLYNDHIRHLRGLPPEFTVGETLVNNYAVQITRDTMLKVEDEVTILEISEQIHKDTIGVDDDGDDIDILYRNMKIRHGLGAVYDNIRLPVDREYVTNLIRWFAQRKNWNKHFGIKKQYPDLRERDGSTVYKAQGSSHNVVIIDLTDISTCRKADQTARQLYVAGSRARQRIICYGTLADKYGGLIF